MLLRRPTFSPNIPSEINVYALSFSNLIYGCLQDFAAVTVYIIPGSLPSVDGPLH